MSDKFKVLEDVSVAVGEVTKLDKDTGQIVSRTFKERTFKAGVVEATEANRDALEQLVVTGLAEPVATKED